jgi:hypothetical protein
MKLACENVKVFFSYTEINRGRVGKYIRISSQRGVIEGLQCISGCIFASGMGQTVSFGTFNQGDDPV